MSALLSNPVERTRFFRFAIVGALGTVVDFVVMNVLVNFLSFHLVFAGTISFIVAVISNFTWNRIWTYPDSRLKPFYRQLIEFFIVSIIGLIIRIPTLAFLEPVISSLLTQVIKITNLSINLSLKTISENLTLALTILIVLFWNFFANRYWTYSDVK